MPDNGLYFDTVVNDDVADEATAPFDHHNWTVDDLLSETANSGPLSEELKQELRIRIASADATLGQTAPASVTSTLTAPRGDPADEATAPPFDAAASSVPLASGSGHNSTATSPSVATDRSATSERPSPQTTGQTTPEDLPSAAQDAAAEGILATDYQASPSYQSIFAAVPPEVTAADTCPVPPSSDAEEKKDLYSDASLSDSTFQAIMEILKSNFDHGNTVGSYSTAGPSIIHSTAHSPAAIDPRLLLLPPRANGPSTHRDVAAELPSTTASAISTSGRPQQPTTTTPPGLSLSSNHSPKISTPCTCDAEPPATIDPRMLSRRPEPPAAGPPTGRAQPRTPFTGSPLRTPNHSAPSGPSNGSPGAQPSQRPQPPSQFASTSTPAPRTVALPTDYFSGSHTSATRTRPVGVMAPPPVPAPALREPTATPAELTPIPPPTSGVPPTPVSVMPRAPSTRPRAADTYENPQGTPAPSTPAFPSAWAPSTPSTAATAPSFLLPAEAWNAVQGWDHPQASSELPEFVEGSSRSGHAAPRVQTSHGVPQFVQGSSRSGQAAPRAQTSGLQQGQAQQMAPQVAGWPGVQGWQTAGHQSTPTTSAGAYVPQNAYMAWPAASPGSSSTLDSTAQESGLPSGSHYPSVPSTPVVPSNLHTDSRSRVATPYTSASTTPSVPSHHVPLPTGRVYAPADDPAYQAHVPRHFRSNMMHPPQNVSNGPAEFVQPVYPTAGTSNNAAPGRSETTVPHMSYPAPLDSSHSSSSTAQTQVGRPRLDPRHAHVLSEIFNETQLRLVPYMWKDFQIGHIVDVVVARHGNPQALHQLRVYLNACFHRSVAMYVEMQKRAQLQTANIAQARAATAQGEQAATTSAAAVREQITEQVMEPHTEGPAPGWQSFGQVMATPATLSGTAYSRPSSQTVGGAHNMNVAPQLYDPTTGMPVPVPSLLSDSPMPPAHDEHAYQSGQNAHAGPSHPPAMTQQQMYQQRLMQQQTAQLVQHQYPPPPQHQQYPVEQRLREAQQIAATRDAPQHQPPELAVRQQGQRQPTVSEQWYDALRKKDEEVKRIMAAERAAAAEAQAVTSEHELADGTGAGSVLSPQDTHLPSIAQSQRPTEMQQQGLDTARHQGYAANLGMARYPRMAHHPGMARPPGHRQPHAAYIQSQQQQAQAQRQYQQHQQYQQYQRQQGRRGPTDAQASAQYAAALRGASRTGHAIADPRYAMANTAHAPAQMGHAARYTGHPGAYGGLAPTDGFVPRESSHMDGTYARSGVRGRLGYPHIPPPTPLVEPSMYPQAGSAASAARAAASRPSTSRADSGRRQQRAGSLSASDTECPIRGCPVRFWSKNCKHKHFEEVHTTQCEGFPGRRVCTITKNITKNPNFSKPHEVSLSSLLGHVRTAHGVEAEEKQSGRREAQDEDEEVEILENPASPAAVDRKGKKRQRDEDDDDEATASPDKRQRQ
ncbi:hypothetical protein PsYK624_119830 [Phanerochaete sordida]|uniref:Uncharacterized protein n=1 Tax=Phanerochaete sordida TaxID=48140 RepID=A0A9P3GIM8_9APHY|nr:hypothetical protein PsYK624_119830 [Phanerochaete sordida]